MDERGQTTFNLSHSLIAERTFADLSSTHETDGAGKEPYKHLAIEAAHT